ncbi:uncharacterized protein LOC134690478 [Mytilus trossulus]|uniref:uncharacterized protein LOC134690478 n=1 Tax=Mytilus trossulus TaxID=6551 RepID=UPI003004F469
MSLTERKLMQMTLLFVILSVVIGTTSGACCHKPFNKHCADCAVGTPCCGYHSCNIFCCGCDCRKEPAGKHCYGRGDTCRCYRDNCRVKRQVSFATTDISAYETFTGLDINKNGMMEQFEFSRALEQMHITDNMTVFHHWLVMDEDRDGVITLEEFDREKL